MILIYGFSELHLLENPPHLTIATAKIYSRLSPTRVKMASFVFKATPAILIPKHVLREL